MKDFTQHGVVKTGIWYLIFIFVFSFSAPPIPLAHAKTKNSVQVKKDRPDYKTDRFIVKLSEDSGYFPSIQSLLHFKYLIKKHNIKEVKSIHQMSGRHHDFRDKWKRIRSDCKEEGWEKQNWHKKDHKDLTRLLKHLKKRYKSKKDKDLKDIVRRHKHLRDKILKIIDYYKNKKSKGYTLPNKDIFTFFTHTFVLEVSEDADMDAIITDFQSDPYIAYAQLDYEMIPKITPDDPSDKEQWGLDMIQAKEAWDISKGTDVVVAILDTGIDYHHKDLSENMWTNPCEIENGKDDDRNGFVDDIHGWDFYEDDNDPWDGHGNGTHAAGTVAAVSSHAADMMGVAPKAKLMAVKGMSDDGFGWASDLAVGMVYATMNKADVINNGWGCTNACPSNPVLEDAVHIAHSRDVVVVFAGGDSGTDMAVYSPQNMRETISVAATDPADDSAWFGNFGFPIDISAPGVSIMSTLPEDQYGHLSGTSRASAYVSGLAALIVSRNPHFSNEQVLSVMRASADDVDEIGYDTNTGHGRINALNALLIDQPIDVTISHPMDGQQIDLENEFEMVEGTVDGEDLDQYTVEYKPSDQSADWELASGPFDMPVTNDMLGDLPLSDLDAGNYMVKVKATSTQGIEYADVVEVETTGLPVITAPHPGSLIMTQDVKMEWRQGTDVDNYWLYVGTSMGATDIFSEDMGTDTSAMVSGVPLNGQDIFVTLQYQIQDEIFEDHYQYSTVSQPVAQDQSVNVDFDTPVDITLVATDSDNDPLNFTVMSMPSHGTLSVLNGTNITYTPISGYAGNDSFTFMANDGVVDSNIATISLSVADPPNTPPVADDQVAEVLFETSKDIMLIATDADDDPLSYMVVTEPAHGALSEVNGAQITYTPDNGFSGSDAFTFMANDGEDDSNVATISLHINTLPEAEDQSVELDQDSSVAITLVATDGDTDNLTYTVVNQPVNGVLSGIAPDVTYTPNAGYFGNDSFTFKADDGKQDSNTATVSISIEAVNMSQAVVWTDIVGVQANGNTITKTAATAWGNAGAVSVQRIPADGLIDFRVDEINTHRMVGLSTSNINEQWESINHALFLRTDGMIQIYESGVLRGSFGPYNIGDRFQIERVGTDIKYFINGNLLYTSPVVSSGDLIVDTSLYSIGATVSDMMIIGGTIPPNNVPIAQDQSILIDVDTSMSMTLVATDADGDTLTYTVVSQPAQGVLSGVAPNVVYTPNNGYTGGDQFTFKASDGQDESNIATVTINVVVPVESQPVVWTDLVGVDAVDNTITMTAPTGWGNAGAVSVQIIQADGGVDFRADETNAHRMVGLSTGNLNEEWESINYALFLRTDGILQIYESGALRGTYGTYNVGDRFMVVRDGDDVQYIKNGSVLYTSTLPSNGDLIVDASIYSPGGTVADALVMGGTNPPNNAPVAGDQEVILDVDSPLNITLVATDEDGDSLTYSIEDQPSNGVLSGTAPNVEYTPNAGYTGSDQFTFKANDGGEDSNVATISMNVVSPLPSQFVVWTDLVGVDAPDNTIIKTAPTTWGNAGAASVQIVPADGGVDFRADEIDTHRMVGLSTDNINEQWESINYALFLRLDGMVQVYEGGVFRGTFGSYDVGDRFMVLRMGTTVQYIKNGSILHTSTAPSSGNLLVDASIYSLGGTVADAMIMGGTEPPNNAPVAIDQIIGVLEDTAKSITLVATDEDGDALTYTIVSQPTHGELTGSAPNLIYTPDSGYTGMDSLMFIANDSHVDSNLATIDLNITTPIPSSPVVWTDLVGVDAMSSTIIKTAGAGWGNAGAVSLQTIPADGGVDFGADETNAHRMVGLSSGNPNEDWETINYALYLRTDGFIQVYENGSLKGTFGSYNVGDRFSVMRFGSSIQYAMNGILIYTSQTPSNGEVIMDSSIFSPGGTVADANIFGGVNPPNTAPVAQDQSVVLEMDTMLNITVSATDADGDQLTYTVIDQPVNGVLSGSAPDIIYTPNNGFTGNDSFTFIANDGEDDSNVATVNITITDPIPTTPVIWTDAVGVDVNGNTITKTAPVGWGNAGAASIQSISGDGGVDVRADETNAHRMVGLSDTNINEQWESMDYALFLRTDGTIQVYESQVLRGTFGSYQVGDRFRVIRTGTTIQYIKNGSVIYTSPAVSTGDLIVDTSIFSPGGTVADAQILGNVD